MKQLFAILVLNFGLIGSLFSQQSGAAKCALQKQQSFKNFREYSNSELLELDQNIDVKYHHLNLKISHVSKSVEGVVSTNAVPVSGNISSVFYNLNSQLQVDSVKINTKKANFLHKSNLIKIDLDKVYQKNEIINTTIYYRGIPPTTAFGSFSVGSHGPSKEPVVWTLSESYGGPTWWPCKDDPSDKIDSSDVWITMDSKFVSVSNGNLIEVSEDKLNAKKTYKWKNSYPIAHYLISLACSNYELYEKQFQYSTNKSMKVSHYIYPEIMTNDLKKQLDETLNMLEIFSAKYGQYPFIKEKYGHAMCNFGGGMEHQTVSSMGGFEKSLIAHELAHQWFGDKVTCKTWSDIWVNEGFATFSEAYYEELSNGREIYDKEMVLMMADAKKARGSVYIQNPLNENEIFNFNRTYQKGAVIIHMLRGVLGDEVFSKVLNSFVNTDFAYGVASIRDFQAVAERISGTKLSYFFDQWLFGESYPSYDFSWQQSSLNTVQLKVKQSLRTTSPNYFKMPIKFKVNFEDGSSLTKQIMVDGLAEQNLEIGQLTNKVVSVAFDPENLVLKDYNFSGASSLVLGNEQGGSNALVYPNPSFDLLNLDKINQKILDLKVYDLNAKEYPITVSEGNFLNIKGLNSGKYYLEINTGAKKEIIRFVKN